MTDRLKKLLTDGCEDIRRLFADLVTGMANITPEHGCVWWSIAVYRYLQGHGIECLLQAGSASFQFVEPGSADDDGVSSTNYAYVCEDGAAWLLAMRQLDTLPEMHAWVVVRSQSGGPEFVFVDWTSQYLVSLCLQHGFVWRQPEPPKVFVATLSDMPAGWSYIGKHVPTAFVSQLERRLPK